MCVCTLMMLNMKSKFTKQKKRIKLCMPEKWRNNVHFLFSYSCRRTRFEFEFQILPNAYVFYSLVYAIQMHEIIYANIWTHNLAAFSLPFNCFDERIRMSCMCVCICTVGKCVWCHNYCKFSHDELFIVWFQLISILWFEISFFCRIIYRS